jgi:hypothetical protein
MFRALDLLRGCVFFCSGTEKETGEQGVDEDLIVKDG